MPRLCTLALLALAAAPLAADDAAEALKRETKGLQGTWKVTSLHYDGKDVLAEGKYGFRFVIKGDEAVVEGNDTIAREYARLRLKPDVSTSPKLLDMVVTGGVQKDVVIEGIYELKDNELKICAKVVGKERPTKFASPEGSSVALVVLKKE